MDSACLSSHLKIEGTAVREINAPFCREHHDVLRILQVDLGGAQPFRAGRVTMNVLVERSDSVTTVVMNRPELRNAVDEETAGELLAAFEDFEQDEGGEGAPIRSHACVLPGSGPLVKG